MRYRCKPDIFAATYEPADAPASGEPSGAEAAVREAWRSVTDSLPKPGADVIAGYRDTAGRWCSVRAVYAAERSVVCTCERDGDCFCEMDDTGESWWPEGWYEIADNAYDVNTWRIRGTVTHWIPLPQAPTAPESETLLPCPFCGGEAARITTRYAEDCDTVKANGGQTLFYGVNCIVCGASTSTVVGYRTPAKADGAWNRRAAHQERDADARRLMEAGGGNATE